MDDSVNAPKFSSSCILSTSEWCDDICFGFGFSVSGLVIIESLAGAFSDIRGSSTCVVSIHN